MIIITSQFKAWKHTLQLGPLYDVHRYALKQQPNLGPNRLTHDCGDHQVNEDELCEVVLLRAALNIKTALCL